MIRQFFRALKEAWSKARQQKTLESITSKGLDMEALKQIASIQEKYIEVRLRDGTLIRIWKDSEKPEPSAVSWW